MKSKPFQSDRWNNASAGVNTGRIELTDKDKKEAEEAFNRIIAKFNSRKQNNKGE